MFTLVVMKEIVLGRVERQKVLSRIDVTRRKVATNELFMCVGWLASKERHQKMHIKHIILLALALSPNYFGICN